MLKRGLEIFPKMVPAMSKNTEKCKRFSGFVSELSSV